MKVLTPYVPDLLNHNNGVKNVKVDAQLNKNNDFLDDNQRGNGIDATIENFQIAALCVRSQRKTNRN